MSKSLNFLLKAIFIVLPIVLFSCSRGKITAIDREANLSFKDYQKSLIKDNETKKDDKNDEKTVEEKSKDLGKTAPIPKISRLVLPPPPPEIGGGKKISFSVTDQVPLKDVLIELGRVAKIDVDVDPNISGGIILNARNRPLKEVIDRIASLGQLRYSYKNGVLTFEKDSPYTKNYLVDFLSGSQLWEDVENGLNSLISKSDAALNKVNSDFKEDKKINLISVNKSAGIISVYGNDVQHQKVSRYLDDVYKVASAQVLIEAKVVEVTLNNEYSAGIDWSWADAVNSVDTTAASSITSPAITASSTKLLGIGGDLAATVKALEKFGTARAISSPRISAINNQEAVLDFSEKFVYFTVSTSSSTSVGTSSNTVSTVTATKNEVPIGVQLSITPSINLSTQEVTLNIQPTLSVNSGEVAKDPSVNPETGESLENEIPIIKTRELKTIAKVQSGSVLVIGGLMSETAVNEDTGIPLLSRIPLLGRLFEFSTRDSNIVETVIFVKATIVNSSTPPSKYDRDFHEKFTVDPKLFLQ